MKIFALFAPRYAFSISDFDGCEPVDLIDVRYTNERCFVKWAGHPFDLPEENWKLSFLFRDFVRNEIAHVERKSPKEGGRGRGISNIRTQIHPIGICAGSGKSIYKVDADVIGRIELDADTGMA